MSGDNDTRLRHSCIQLQPTVVKQFDYLIAIDSRHLRGWRMSQHALDLRMRQGVISPCAGDKIHACLKQLSHSYCVPILPIETN